MHTTLHPCSDPHRKKGWKQSQSIHLNLTAIISIHSQITIGLPILSPPEFLKSSPTPSISISPAETFCLFVVSHSRYQFGITIIQFLVSLQYLSLISLSGFLLAIVNSYIKDIRDKVVSYQYE